MVLSANEESLIKAVRMLPPDEASKVLVWAQQLDYGKAVPAQRKPAAQKGV